MLPIALSLECMEYPPHNVNIGDVLLSYKGSILPKLFIDLNPHNGFEELEFMRPI